MQTSDAGLGASIMWTGETVHRLRAHYRTSDRTADPTRQYQYDDRVCMTLPRHGDGETHRSLCADSGRIIRGPDQLSVNTESTGEIGDIDGRCPSGLEGRRAACPTIPGP